MSNKKDKNENVDEKLDTALLDSILAVELLDTEIELLTDENGTLDGKVYTFLQCFNDDKFNNQTHAQWSINYENICNELGIKCKQKDEVEKTKAGIIKSDLKVLSDKMRSRISKIKRFQSTTVSKAQAKKGIEPIGKNITKTTKWYTVKTAVAPIVDEDFLDMIKVIRKWTFKDVAEVIQFHTLKNDMDLLDDFVEDIKDNFEIQQKENELEKNAQAQANAK